MKRSEREETEKITEKRNKASRDLDLMDTEDMVRLINREDARVASAVRDVIPELAQFIDAAASCMKKGGRLFYVGAGTSGRMGVIDAVECTPTFSLSPDRVQGILAGGKEAMFKAREGLEDDRDSGRKRMAREDLKGEDVVLGIAASGSTPFVLGAVERANASGALTGALVCNYNSELAELTDHSLKVIVGPEVLTGSTRMKAGTAQKMVLNTLSTAIMVRLGKVYSNLMVDLQAKNSKLRKRAKKIFRQIAGGSREKAEKYLKKADFDVKTAITMYERGCKKREAEKLLDEKEGDLRKVIG